MALCWDELVSQHRSHHCVLLSVPVIIVCCCHLICLCTLSYQHTALSSVSPVAIDKDRSNFSYIVNERTHYTYSKDFTFCSVLVNSSYLLLSLICLCTLSYQRTALSSVSPVAGDKNRSVLFSNCK